MATVGGGEGEGTAGRGGGGGVAATSRGRGGGATGRGEKEVVRRRRAWRSRRPGVALSVDMEVAPTLGVEEEARAAGRGGGGGGCSSGGRARRMWQRQSGAKEPKKCRARLCIDGLVLIRLCHAMPICAHPTMIAHTLYTTHLHFLRL